jgi:hypothetical protein
MTKNIIFTVRFIVAMIGLYYIGYVNSLLKGSVPDIHRFLICIGLIFAVYSAAMLIGGGLIKRTRTK